MSINKNLGTIASYLWTIFLFLSFHPFILWIVWPGLVTFPVYISIYILTLLLLSRKELVFTHKRVFLFVIILAFAFQITLPIFTSNLDIGKLMSLMTFSLFTFYPNSVYLQVFNRFRKLMILFAISSIVLFVLLLLNIDLPYYRIEGFTLPMAGGDYYRLYGFIVSSTNTLYNFGGLTFARACGPFLEPGHFGIYLGLVLCGEKILIGKTNLWLNIAGFFTFSPAFILIFLLLIFYDFIVLKQFKNLKVYLIILLSIVILILNISPEMRENIWYLAVDRNVESEGDSVWDDRSDQNARVLYDKLSKTPEIIVGKGTEFLADIGMLSDLRGFILKHGLLGLFLSFLICIVILSRAKKLSQLWIYLPVIVLVFSHRSWMFEAAYIYMLISIIISGSIQQSSKLI
ncbi:hypothetical protein [Sphingobacterium sp. NPDC055346]